MIKGEHVRARVAVLEACLEREHTNPGNRITAAVAQCARHELAALLVRIEVERDACHARWRLEAQSNTPAKGAPPVP